MKTLKDKIINFIKIVQAILTGIGATLMLIWDTIDIDLDDAKKDEILRIIQIIGFSLMGIYVIIWWIIPYFQKQLRKYKYSRLGCDVEKFDEWWDNEKEKVLASTIEDIKKTPPI